jgi:hypothetical protein
LAKREEDKGLLLPQELPINKQLDQNGIQFVFEDDVWSHLSLGDVEKLKLTGEKRRIQY